MTEAASTALTQAKSGGLAAFTGTSNPFIRAADKEGVTDGLYLRMNGKTGKLISNYPDMSEFAPGTELVFDVFNAVVLWQGFDAANKPYYGPHVTILSGAPLADHPPTAGVKWVKQIRIMVAPTDGGKQMSFTSKADNSFRSVWKLIKKYGEQLARFPDPTSKTGFMSPIVRITVEEKNTVKKEEKVRTNPETGAKEIYEEDSNIQYFVEQFEIVDWMTQAEQEAALASKGLLAEDQSGQAAPTVQLSAPVAAPVAVTQPAAVALGVATEPVKVVKEVEIIPPPASNAGTPAGFRRDRIGQRT